MSFTEKIKEFAMKAGFNAVGITSAEPFVEAEQTLRERRELGHMQGSRFQYEENIYSHTHPRHTMPSARSIISVALSYLTKDTDLHPEDEKPRGSMAPLYARGLDYHTIMHEHLKILTECIRSKVKNDADIHPIVDTGPLADRAAAIRAGVGFPGKNTCIYIPGYGSWVVLGELLTDIELEPDTYAPSDICGKCKKCMTACPTGAIIAPYVIDQRLCIARITSKGCIPISLRQKIGTRLYGCDTCQSVCPLNKEAKAGNVADFHPSRGLGSSPELIPLLNITNEEYENRVAPTTASWIGRDKFRRNAAVVLGNIGDPAAVPGLIEALQDPSTIVRGHAAWALGRIGGSRARTALENALIMETEDRVRDEITEALF